MPIDRLLGQHAHILAAAETLAAIAEATDPVPDDQLRRARWTLIRDLFAHLDDAERSFYAPLRVDLRSDAVLHAIAASRARDAAVARLCRHVVRWPGVPSAEQWRRYRLSLRRVVRRIRDHLDGEARDFARYWPASPKGDVAPRPRDDLAAQGWSLRAVIEGASDTPTAVPDAAITPALPLPASGSLDLVRQAYRSETTPRRCAAA